MGVDEKPTEGVEPSTYALRNARSSSANSTHSTAYVESHPAYVLPDALTPELARIVASWPDLPPHIRAAVLTLVDSVAARRFNPGEPVG